MRQRSTYNQTTVALLLALAALLAFAAPASANFSITEFSASSTSSAAGAHPDLTTKLVFSSTPNGPYLPPDGNARDISVELPPGLTGDPSALPQCGRVDFLQLQCPLASTIGVASVKVTFDAFPLTLRYPVVNLQPRNQEVTAEIGFVVLASTFVLLQISPRSEGDYGLTNTSLATSHLLGVDGVDLTIWGTPGDPSHDGEWLSMIDGEPLPAPQTPRVPFFTNPTTCGGPLPVRAVANSWQEPERYSERSNVLPPITGCDQLEFHPSFKARPTTDKVDSPSGLEAVISMPQHDSYFGQNEEQDLTVTADGGQFDLSFGGQTTADLPFNASSGEVQAALAGLSSIGSGNIAVRGGPGSEDGSTPYRLIFRGALGYKDVEQVSVGNGATPLQGFAEVDTVAEAVAQGTVGEESATPALRDATVTLPKGIVINPSSANGLGACSPQQMGILPPSGEPGTHFNRQAPSCPESSNLGTVKVITPVFNDPLHGHVYLATPHDNPFGSLLALYLNVEGHGLQIKLAGKVTADPQSGQLTTTFVENPQLPVEELQLQLNPGALGPLRTPAACGTYTSTASLTPWSAPQSGPAATPSDSYAIDRAAGGGACSTPPAAPAFDAGTVTAVSGIYSPFALNLSREDGSPEIAGLDDTLPPGLLAKLAGVPYCSDAGLAAAAAKDGKAEQAQPSCSVASQVGTVTVGAGAGPGPFYAAGKAYLTGPYKGAPLSLAVIVPAVAGPFDLGTVVVRTALQVDPTTAQVRAVSDPFPHILQGIPIDIRSIALRIDRDRFIRTPTSCDPFAVTGSALFTNGQSAPTTSRFQVAECGRLGFKPKLKLSLTGQTKRVGHPKVKAVLSAPADEANIAATTVMLPSSEFIDNAHINNPCTRVQFAADQCPANSILGFAKATTPLLDKPLEGPVYFRSNGGERELPDMVADLNGQIHVTLVGFIDAVKVKGTEQSRVRTRFQNVPDAPVSRFELSLFGGKRGLLQNSRDLCGAGLGKASLQLIAHNGVSREYGQKLATSCHAKKAKKKNRGSGK